LEKGVHVDYIHVELGSHKPAWYAEKVNPLGTVPCIYDEGRPVFESLNVVEFLDEKFPDQGTHLMPRDPHARQSVRFFVSQVGDKLIKPLYALLTNSDRAKDDVLKEELTKVLSKINDLMESSSPEGPYYLGSEFSLADISVVTFLDRFQATLKFYRNYDLWAHAARLKKCYDACKSREAFKITSQNPEFYIWGYESYANKR